MSFFQPLWDSTESTERPMILALRLSNSPLALAKAPSSVVQTGVKSFGWENSTPHELPSHSWKLIVPSVVSAVKSGAMSPRRTAMSPPAVVLWSGADRLPLRRLWPDCSGPTTNCRPPESALPLGEYPGEEHRDHRRGTGHGRRHQPTGPAQCRRRRHRRGPAGRLHRLRRRPRRIGGGAHRNGGHLLRRSRPDG